eukprot:6444553-Prymnesium_polylepis.1
MRLKKLQSWRIEARRLGPALRRPLVRGSPLAQTRWSTAPAISSRAAGSCRGEALCKRLRRVSQLDVVRAVPVD